MAWAVNTTGPAGCRTRSRAVNVSERTIEHHGGLLGRRTPPIPDAEQARAGSPARGGTHARSRLRRSAGPFRAAPRASGPVLPGTRMEGTTASSRRPTRTPSGPPSTIPDARTIASRPAAATQRTRSAAGRNCDRPTCGGAVHRGTDRRIADPPRGCPPHGPRGRPGAAQSRSRLRRDGRDRVPRRTGGRDRSGMRDPRGRPSPVAGEARTGRRVLIDRRDFGRSRRVAAPDPDRRTRPRGSARRQNARGSR